jgi:hypothetical protein
MDLKLTSFFLFFLIIGMSILPHSYSDSYISIEMDKKIWEFGDFLSYVIKISEITGDDVKIYIRDESGKKSGPPPFELTQLQTTIPSMYPLHPDQGFKEGKYYIDVEYGNHKDSVEFNIIDTGKAIIPTAVRVNTMIWIGENFPDEFFAKEIRTLIKENILAIPENQEHSKSSEFKLPSWVKVNTVYWWLSGETSDKEFIQALQYLIKIKTIVI